jgi:protein-S-isoprenylcysteine O-methyltransferase Ste14
VPSRFAGSILKTLVFTVLVPGFVTLLIPYVLEAKETHWPVAWVNWLAMVPCLLGGSALLWCAWDFAVVGRGTPAPIDPPKSVVVSGLYRFVRNPMYVGVELVILGEAWLFCSARLLGYALLLGPCFHLFVVFYEEPTLRRRFGGPYQEYCQAVPRWIPRLTPWSRKG